MGVLATQTCLLEKACMYGGERGGGHVASPLSKPHRHIECCMVHRVKPLPANSTVTCHLLQEEMASLCTPG